MAKEHNLLFILCFVIVEAK